MTENERAFRKRRKEILFTVYNPELTEDEIFFLLLFYQLNKIEQNQVYFRMRQIYSEEQAGK